MNIGGHGQRTTFTINHCNVVNLQHLHMMQQTDLVKVINE